jgi:hypothetical protein
VLVVGKTIFPMKADHRTCRPVRDRQIVLDHNRPKLEPNVVVGTKAKYVPLDVEAVVRTAERPNMRSSA